MNIGDNMNRPHLAVMYKEGLPEDTFEKLESELSSDGLDIDVRSRPDGGMYACAEWYIPAAVIAYIGKSYFGIFLKEMGKDHYQILKNSLSGLTNEVMSNPRIEPTLSGSKGKLSSNNPYSLALSIEAEANEKERFKLLLPKSESKELYKIAVDRFLEFVSDFHDGVKDLDSINCILGDRRPPSGIIFVRLNPESEKIEWVDDRAHR
jgi:hypothetical protein